jgi:hypothetical protein
MSAGLNTNSKKTIGALISRLGGAGVHVLENSTEELIEGTERRGKVPRLFSMAQREVRLEENYLYSTRRFPNNTTSDTIGSGAVTAADYNFFSQGVGDLASAVGYFSLGNLTYQQTNMAAGGKIPTGRGFKMFDLGVSFNAAASTGDIAQCLDTMSLRFEKQAAALTVFHGPIKFWPGGTGIYGFAATTQTTTTIQGASNGMPALTNVRRYRNPRILAANEDFKYVITAGAKVPASAANVALGAFVEVTVWLFGQVLDAIPQ